MGQADALKQGQSPFFGFAALHTQNMDGRHGNVVQRAEMREQIEALEHKANAATQLVEFDAVQRCVYVVAIKQQLPGVHVFQAVDGADQGGFARSRWSAQNDHLAFFDFGRDVRKGVVLAVPLVDLVEKNHGAAFSGFGGQCSAGGPCGVCRARLAAAGPGDMPL